MREIRTDSSIDFDGLVLRKFVFHYPLPESITFQINVRREIMRNFMIRVKNRKHIKTDMGARLND